MLMSLRLGECNSDIATHMKSDFDSAPSPDLYSRIVIYGSCGNILKVKELTKLAMQSNHFTGRDIQNICEKTVTAQLLRGEIDDCKVAF